MIIFNFCFYFQRAEASEREIEQIRTKLTEVTQKQKLGETTQEAPDMDRAIDMFKRTGLEHELAAKEKEVKKKKIRLLNVIDTLPQSPEIF